MASGFLSMDDSLVDEDVEDGAAGWSEDEEEIKVFKGPVIRVHIKPMVRLNCF